MGCGCDRKHWQLESHYPPDACRLSEASHVAGPRCLHRISHPGHIPWEGSHCRGGRGPKQRTYRGVSRPGWFRTTRRVPGCESWRSRSRDASGPCFASWPCRFSSIHGLTEVPWQTEALTTESTGRLWQFPTRFSLFVCVPYFPFFQFRIFFV